MYNIELTEEEMRSIDFVGHRYGWSDWLSKHCHAGMNDLSEHEAWEFKDEADGDTEGDHSYFPMLDNRSELALKLYRLLGSIV